jgi:hypothetical protein
MNTTGLSNALLALCDLDVEYTDRDGTYENLEWHDTVVDKPSEDVINTEIARQIDAGITDYSHTETYQDKKTQWSIDNPPSE